MAEGWASYPLKNYNSSDYWRAPDMRPERFPGPLVADSKKIVDELVAATTLRKNTNLLRAASFHKVSAVDMLVVHALLKWWSSIRRAKARPQDASSRSG